MRKLIAIAVGVAAALLGTVAWAARNSSGTYTLSPSAPFTSGTVISSSTMNTRFSDLATETTDSLSRSGKGGMLAALRGVDGSVGVPAYSFTSDTDTGFYRIAPGEMALSLNGVLQVDWGAVITTVTPPTAFLDALYAGTVGAQAADDVTFVSSVTFTKKLTASADATFAGSTVVPTPVATTEAANKAYVDQYVAVVTTAYADFPERSNHACNVETVTGSASIADGFDCVNVTTGLTTEQILIDSVYFVGTTGYVRWCTQSDTSTVDPAARTYRFRCFKAP